MARVDIKKLKLIHKLLQEASSLELVSDFLRAKNLPHSAGSWQNMLEKRLQPYLENNQIKLAEIIDFLDESEGHGKQHVFLYRARNDSQRELLRLKRLESIISSENLISVVNRSFVIDLPKNPTISSIQIKKADSELAQSIEIKLVEKRESQHHVGDTVRGKFLTKRYEIVTERAVSIARLDLSGVLELRIGSRANTSKYKSDVDAFWGIVNKLILRESFAELHLRRARDLLAKQPPELSDIVRYSQTIMRDPTGATMKLATGQPDSDLTRSPAAKAGSAAFTENNGACESSNIWFRAEKTSLARDLHILLGGETNEFAITQHCAKADYEYVLRQILSFNA